MTIAGATTIHVAHASLPDELQHRIRHYDPKTDLGKLVKSALRYLPRPHAEELLDTILRSVVMQSELSAVVYRALPSGAPWPRDPESGWDPYCRRHLQPVPLSQMPRELWKLVEPAGVLSRKVVTNTGVDFIVDAFQNIVELELLKFHGIGNPATANAEAATDSALQTELTTQYNPDSTRATGSTTEVAGTPTKYRTVGTNTVDASATIKEHGILSQAATGGGTLLDRSAFDASPLSLVSGDSLQSTYDLTISAGG
jgi:hypothetical protein